MLLSHDYLENPEIFTNESQIFSLNFNQKLKVLLQKYFFKNIANWISCKNKLCSNLF